MTLNFIKTTLRNIRRRKVYSIINITGLSLGMACCILIFLWGRDELSFDAFHERADSIYRIAIEYSPGGQPVQYAVVPAPLAPALAVEFPQIKAAVRFWRDISLESVSVDYGLKSFNEERFFFADLHIFDVFTFPMLEGDPETALSEPFSLVITEDTARRYFDDADPLGKYMTVNMETARKFKITGIMQNIPSNSHIKFDFLASMTSLNDMRGYQLMNWNQASFYSYMLLHEGISADMLEKRLPDFIRKHFGEDVAVRMRLFLQPLKEIHLNSHIEDELETNVEKSRIIIFSTTALLVLFIACINFMNLSIAQSTARANEVGIRKVLGAVRTGLARQFIGESLVFSFLALFIALCLVEISLPGFNLLTGKTLTLDYGRNILLLLVLAGTALFTGLVSGSYPAFILSSFSAAEVFRGYSRVVFTHTMLRKSLVVIQFAVSAAFIIATAQIYDQLKYLQNMQLGFSKEHVVVMPMREKHMQLNYESLKKELLGYQRIFSATASSNVPCGPVIPQRREFRLEGSPQEELLAMFCLFVDRDFLETYGIDLIDGENFSNSRSGTRFILNETAVRETGWSAPVGKKISHWIPQTGTVIGVVKDFHFMPLHNKIEPLLLYFSPRWFQYLSIKISSDDIPGALAFIEKKWRKWFPHSPFEYTFLDNQVMNRYNADIRLGKVLGSFSLVAIFIACIGLFGLTSLSIEQHTKEIGIRKVLGASVKGIISLIFKEFMKLVVYANVIAWPIVWFAIKAWQENFAYHAGIKPVLFVYGSMITFIIAIITISYQAFKAALANPVDSLRHE